MIILIKKEKKIPSQYFTGLEELNFIDMFIIPLRETMI